MKSHSKQKKSFDVAIIGAGSAGLTAAISLSAAGKSVLLVERDKPGGECTHSGCVPSKALLHSAKTQYISGKTDSVSALEYTQNRIDHIYAEETPEILESHGITVISGEASFKTRCSISVNGTDYGFKKSIIATGSSPRMIEIPGLDGKYVLTNQNFFEQTELPKRLLVIGSGPIGMELSQAAAMLGSEVTIASIDTSFARFEDPDVGKILEQKFNDLGVRIMLESSIVQVSGNTAIFETVSENNKKEVQVEFDKILIAIGRVPNLPKGLAAAGIKSKPYGVVVNSNYRTTNRSVYAIGDVSQQFKFTHTANDTARGVVKHILTKGILGYKKKSVPKVTYTSPEVAQVGISYTDAVAKYGQDNIVRINTPYSTNDRAKTDNAENGLVVVIAKRLSGKILGANIIGQSAGEILASYTLAMDHGVSMWKLSGTIYPYPTISQVVKKSGDQFSVQTLSNIKSELIYFAKKHAAKLFALIFWSSLLYWFYHFKSVNNYDTKAVVSMLYDFIVTHPAGPITYMAIYVLRPLIFFPATILTALSGALFGLPLGILYTIIGENGSANLAYWIGRFFGKDAHLEDSKLIGPFISRSREDPFIAVLLMRFLYVPFDLTNYGSGIMKIKWSAYAMATLIGILPGLVTFVALGASINVDTLLSAQSFKDLAGGFNPIIFAFSIGLFVTSIALARYFKKRHA